VKQEVFTQDIKDALIVHIYKKKGSWQYIRSCICTVETFHAETRWLLWLCRMDFITAR